MSKRARTIHNTICITPELYPHVVGVLFSYTHVIVIRCIITSDKRDDESVSRFTAYHCHINTNLPLADCIHVCKKLCDAGLIRRVFNPDG